MPQGHDRCAPRRYVEVAIGDDPPQTPPLGRVSWSTLRPLTLVRRVAGGSPVEGEHDARIRGNRVAGLSRASIATIIVPRDPVCPEKVSTIDVRQWIGDMLNRLSLRHDEFVIERKGKALAALVPVER